MDYRERAPVAGLRAHVETFWSLEAAAGEAPHRVLPDGCIDVLFDGTPGARAVGPMTRAIVTATGRSSSLFGVRFHPGCAPAFLGVAARDLRDLAIPLDDVWGPLARSLADAVASAPSAEARARAVERVLLARLASRRRRPGEEIAEARVRGAVAALRASRGSLSIDALAARIGAAERTLERSFDERVGYGPKLLARVIRLQRVVAAIDGTAPPWSTLAADLGFADQAHLVRELGSLAGATPGDLLRERRAVSDFFKMGPAGAVTVPPSPVLSRRQEVPR